MKDTGTRVPRRVVCAILEKAGKVLIARRRENEGGMWEFPGGAVKKDESPEQAIAREIKEELGIDIAVGEFLMGVDYEDARLSIRLMAYRASPLAGDFRLTDHDMLMWVAPVELDESLFSFPDRPIVRHLKQSAKREPA
ncbi:MAG: (deoxy)nucleoside triphosphate pyrophosphohydrolase [Dehalococcoidales bacterium]|nr:(deoxy)nucleoside triphosphate pyrophosphohydrolase [Dehalococcoidales bacterium]